MWFRFWLAPIVTVFAVYAFFTSLSESKTQENSEIVNYLYNKYKIDRKLVESHIGELSELRRPEIMVFPNNFFGTVTLMRSCGSYCGNLLTGTDADIYYENFDLWKEGVDPIIDGQKGYYQLLDEEDCARSAKCRFSENLKIGFLRVEGIKKQMPFIIRNANMIINMMQKFAC